MRKIKHPMAAMAILIILASTQLSAATAPDQETVTTVLAQDTPLYPMLATPATKWKEALINKDIQALQQMVPQLQAREVQRQLEDHESALYRGLFDDATAAKDDPKAKSPHSILKDAKKLRMEIIVIKSRHENDATAYFYDENDISIQFPMDKQKESELFLKKLVICPLQWTGTTWKADYQELYTEAGQGQEEQ